MQARARIAQKDGETYLVIGRQPFELRPLAPAPEDLSSVAGKQVEVETRHTIVGLSGIEDQVRAYLLKQFVAERIIGPEIYNRLVGQ